MKNILLKGSAVALAVMTLVTLAIDPDTTTIVSSCAVASDCSETEVCSQLANPGAAGFCIDTTGSVDMGAVIQADIESMPLPPAYGLGRVYSLPSGAELRVSEGIVLKDRIILEGNGAVLVPDPGVTALTITVDITDTSVDPRTHSSWSSVKNLTVRPANPWGAIQAGKGILIQSHGVRLSNIFVMKLDTCIELFAQNDSHNANNARFRDIVVSSCGSEGVYIHGGESNSGMYLGVETFNGAGIRDSSFLGSVWISPHSETNTVYSINVEGTTPSTVIGAYIEQGDPFPVNQTPSSLWLGGNGVRDLPNSTNKIGYGKAALTFATKSGDYQVSIPRRDGTALMHFQKRGPGLVESYGWELQVRGEEWGFFSEAEIDHPSTNHRAPIRWTIDGAPSGATRAGTSISSVE